MTPERKHHWPEEFESKCQRARFDVTVLPGGVRLVRDRASGQCGWLMPGEERTRGDLRVWAGFVLPFAA
jgi:hypothetical protein